MSDRIICCVVELESPPAGHEDDPDQVACKSCGGLNAIRVIHDNEDLGSYTADALLGGASLQSYRFDDQDPVEMPEQYPGPYIPIPYPPGSFAHLCLRYNREGGAHINVVAAALAGEHAAAHRIRPAHLPANGTDDACPIKSATLGNGKKKHPVDLAAMFTWRDEAAIHIASDAEKGGFHAEPGEGKGDFVFVAKPTLRSGDALTGYRFVSWERNLLSRSMAGTQNQWIEETDTETFDSDTFASVVACYELVTLDPKDPGKQYLPGKETPGYPLPFREILLEALAVFHRVEDLARGLFSPHRHAPGAGGHGQPLGDLPIDEHQRRRLIELARGGEATHAELVRLLERIHAGRSG